MAKQRVFRTRLRQFVDIFRRGVPLLLRLLRIPKLIHLVNTRLRLKLIVFFWISLAAALVLASCSGWLSREFDSPRHNYSSREQNSNFKENADEIAQRLNNHDLSVQEIAKIEGLMSSKAQYASERYYLTREDGSVIAKSPGADETKIDVFKIIQLRIDRGLGEVLDEDYIKHETSDRQSSNQSTNNQLTTGPTIEVQSDTQGTDIVEDERNYRPRYVYLIPISQTNFQGYIVGYINQENFNPAPTFTPRSSDSYWFNQMIVGIGTFFIVFFYLTRDTLKTIEDISNTSRKIAKGDFQARVPKHTEDELGELADHINLMVCELEDSIDKERQARQARDELITSASHDLRTPLTSMIGYLELLSHDQRSEQEKRRFVEIAYKKTQRLKNLVDDLFEFTKSSSGDLKLNKQPIDLCELFAQLLAEFEPMLEQEGIESQLQCPGEIIVSVDPEKIVRVFENLVTNAIRYGKEGKKISVVVAREETTVAITVTNYGSPIPPQDLVKIFQRFYRVEKSRSEQTGGSGLGLAIAKNLVERHGGSISVNSNEEDTTFQVRLPLLSTEGSIA
jgi:signal transduction histidine kinase